MHYYRLTDSGTLTRCEITTYEPEPNLDLPFDNERRAQRLIMKVHILMCRLIVVCLMGCSVGMAQGRIKRARSVVRQAHNCVLAACRPTDGTAREQSH
jgi:Repair protein Rad1/Rec1/Rad17